MAKKKGATGKAKEPRVREGSGPPSATRNEREQGGKDKRGGGALPKVGKHDTSDGGSRDRGLH
jgi:hypothetical protein